ncbi:MAG: NAD-dependent DNA ligase LigA [Burkholderiales bacterium]|nr:NAD-dependent DNA ligase LigA [Burkholderiales bacterium]
MDSFNDVKHDDLLQIKARIDELTPQIIKYNYYYHVKDESLIPDTQYDILFRELQELESKCPQYKWNNSPTDKVGGMPIGQFSQKEHVIPMLSLNNIFSDMNISDNITRHAELFQFNKRIVDSLGLTSEYIATPKYDGVAISLIYINGQLQSGITRGDGFIGEDVTPNIKTIRNIPTQLLLNNPPKLLEVRGEILIKTKDFTQLNQTQANLGLKTFANPRNLASGSIRQLDSSITASRALHFFAYSITQLSVENNFTTYLDQLNYLKNAGFDTGTWVTPCKNVDELIGYYENILNHRNTMPFGIDGVVYKVNNIAWQNKLGFVMRAPRFAIAHKFPSEECESQLIDIQIQVGRTGALTPVAQIKPIALGGVIVSNATLHNQDEIERKDIRIHDYVLVRRAGDVIPEIVKVVLNKRPTNTQKFVMPTSCPVCGSYLIQELNETIIRCSGGLFCDAQKKQAITHFASKLAMNIDGLGDKVVKQLVDYHLINHIVDIYKLTQEQLEPLERFATKKAINLINAINKSKTTTLNRLIYALGIRHVGERTAKDIANTFGSIQNLMKANLTQLMQVNDIGQTVANSIIKFFLEAHNQEIINQLIALGITYPIVTVSSNYNQYISGKIFVVTGTMINFSRDAIKTKIEQFGGKIAGSISKKTDYILCGAETGSKLEKAQALGINILSEAEFLKFL